MKLSEFFIEIIVDAEKGQLTVGDLIKKFGMLEAATLGEIGALLELAQGFAGIVEHSMGVAKGLNMISQENDISIVKLQKWGEAAAEAGWNAAALTSAAVKTSDAIADLQLTGQGPLMILQHDLGVNLAGLDPRDPFGLWMRIKDSMDHGKMKGMLAPYIKDLFGKAGLDPDLMMVLKMTNAQRLAAMSHTSPMTADSMKTYVEMTTEFTILKAKSDNLRHSISDWAAPTMVRDLRIMVDLLDRLDKFFLSHKAEINQVMGVMTAPAKAVGTAAAYVTLGAEKLMDRPEGLVAGYNNFGYRVPAEPAPAPAPVAVTVVNKTEVKLDGRHLATKKHTHAAIKADKAETADGIGVLLSAGSND